VLNNKKERKLEARFIKFQKGYISYFEFQVMLQKTLTIFLMDDLNGRERCKLSLVKQ
jgi:hypothetical protein